MYFVAKLQKDDATHKITEKEKKKTQAHKKLKKWQGH